MGVTELIIYVFGVFISIIGGTLINIFLRVYFDVFRFIRVLKYDFPIIPKSVEVILAWRKAISHENSQNSRIPGIPGVSG